MTPAEQMTLARWIARKLAKGHDDWEDLVQDGLVAMLEDAPHFDPARGVPFKCFLEQRARWAMLDGIRGAGVYCRRRRMRRVEFLHLVGEDDEEEFLPETAPTQEADVLLAERHQQLRRAIRALPPRERDIVRRYYYGGELMHEIGAAIGVNESRVSQLLKQARGMLRATLSEEC